MRVGTGHFRHACPRMGHLQYSAKYERASLKGFFSGCSRYFSSRHLHKPLHFSVRLASADGRLATFLVPSYFTSIEEEGDRDHSHRWYHCHSLALRLFVFVVRRRHITLTQKEPPDPTWTKRGRICHACLGVFCF